MSNAKRRDSKGRVLFTGECQERDGSYTYRYTDASGKRRKITSWQLTSTDRTPEGKKVKKPLREQEKEIQAMLSKGIYDEGITVNELVERYLETKTIVSHNTLASHNAVKKLIAGYKLGSMKIKDVTYSGAKIFIKQLKNDGKSYNSVCTVRSVLRPAFQMAVEDRMLEFNPFAFKITDVITNDSTHRNALTKQQEQQFLDFVKNNSDYAKYYDGIYILFHTGVRISEFCGLTVDDIDFVNHTLTVERQLINVLKGEYSITSTKTYAGKRLLPIEKDVEECFKRIVERCDTNGPVIDGYQGFLYLDRNGMPFLAKHWDHYFHCICQAYNKVNQVPMPNVTPHVCRHTYCSNLAKSGINVKALQYLMGHSNVSTTLDVYTHFGFEDVKKSLDEISSENH